MAEVESFQLDHTKVLAPYVRLIGTETGPKGDIITNFDVRFVQPNHGEIPTSGLHTIEHSMASLIRDRMDGMIDFSPFGCRTGFHMIMWGEPTAEEIAKVITSSLEELAGDSFTWDNVPGVAEKECGNYRDHSLFSAKEWAKKILSEGISSDAFERRLVK
ncbi:S-ribosylhomocysteine lyase [Lactococcus formosensis]|jgi:S-ribosylhomocysteine lyase|uniref:S-ribosylhomocysteine lyase n=1 Tax=Lactococcus formosensis TaxID=1281486 RepID=A0A9X4P6G5_9LACT|nr:S-ribosylhomocysteine lyase [Lactococcus formosensis]MDG6120245.1 S-ribosylhomocysteine lyase [Lactococcus formosensis]MDG6143242.1 S-ribosylhomocysteine lyase [Lactococcus formosensis]MDG6155607.1 S-ribosylhomocysteine lyase [Lactococcus formosensis]MDG6160540.1 S-ribosylhomocysteine lyase [Lactococcus formosensis]MDG6166788.1 S-ribosylhomocysteine lyase [Lactococcus formosensis]